MGWESRTRGVASIFVQGRSGGWMVFGCLRRGSGGYVGNLDFASSFLFLFLFFPLLGGTEGYMKLLLYTTNRGWVNR